MLDLVTIALQIVLPLLLIALVAWMPWSSRAEIAVQLAGAFSVLLALLLAAVWMIPPWWVPYGWLALLAGAAVWRLRRDGWPARCWPQNWASWTVTIAIGALGIWSATVTADALAGRRLPPDVAVANLAFPLGPGTYLVASGGSSASVNGHFLTLHPRTARQRAYRGQSYAVDLIRIDRWGLRASGWRPRDPAAYAIFGEPVFAPCAGEVLRAHDGMPDMPVPQTDRSRLEGNHVILKCGDQAVVLGHLRQGSVTARTGQFVRTGDRLGEVGNSGQSTEPHLHIHAQQTPKVSGPIMAGEPVHLTLDGRFPVRNARICGSVQ